MAKPRRTIFAEKAVGLADMFRISFDKARIEGPVAYRPVMSAPEGESTGGGRQAVQHVALVPDDGGPTLVFGEVDQKSSSARLRTASSFFEMLNQRFKSSIPEVDRLQYDQMVTRVEALLSNQGLTVEWLSAVAPSNSPCFQARDTSCSAPRAQPSSRGRRGDRAGLCALDGVLGSRERPLDDFARVHDDIWIQDRLECSHQL